MTARRQIRPRTAPRRLFHKARTNSARGAATGPSRPGAALGAVLGLALLASGCGVLPGEEEDGPITVMTWAPVKTRATNMPGVTALAKAYARWVNAEGGLNGRELRVITCNEGNTGVRAAQCARRAKDEGVVAVVGSYSQHGQSFMPHLESVGIPHLGGYGFTEEEFTSPLSYPVNGGQPALLAGSGSQLAGSCEQVALVRPDTTAGDELPELFNAGLAGRDREPAADVLAPEDSADYTGEAERALSGAGSRKLPEGAAGPVRPRAEGSCVTAALGGRTGTFLDSFNRLHRDHERVLLGSVAGSVQQALVNRTGGSGSPLEGSYVTSWYPAGGDPVWERMKEVVREHAFGDNRIDTYDPGVQTTWVAYTVLRRVVESIEGEVTRHTVQQRLDSGPPVSTGGITPPLAWRYDDLLGTRSYPRLVNSKVSLQRVEGGVLVASGQEELDVAPILERAGRRN
ncbi:ABC transporter substrate-binding protein [Streptomyces sp. XM4193]|uniref:ABC transporter substrate-binding protein n=1 Tax=Streptomyces sp. XM4193 TaxID=2929782 RepID=UPI001FF73796|nr:ABC transporter substrate-binding protein [Streptomyces sp. XM4193]MCK1796719.1 ABC transporter substrate-binding protein [Streptomyces sp. XM4193]